MEGYFIRVMINISKADRIMIRFSGLCFIPEALYITGTGRVATACGQLSEALKH